MNMIQASVFTVHRYTVVPRDQIIFRGRKLVHYDSLSFVHSFIRSFVRSFVHSCIITHGLSLIHINSFIIINRYESLSCIIIHCHWSSLSFMIVHSCSFTIIHYQSVSFFRSFVHSVIYIRTAPVHWSGRSFEVDTWTEPAPKNTKIPKEKHA